MARITAWVAVLFIGGFCLAVEAAEKPDSSAEVKPFLRSIVKSLLDKTQAPDFAMADNVIAIDNGEQMTKEQLKSAWPDFRKMAFKKKVTLDEFFEQVQLQVSPAKDNKSLSANKRLMEVYKPQDGDLYCDLSKVKDGVDSFIGYKKAFIYILRKVDGKWTLIAIGG